MGLFPYGLCRANVAKVPSKRGSGLDSGNCDKVVMTGKINGAWKGAAGNDEGQNAGMQSGLGGWYLQGSILTGVGSSPFQT